MKTALIWAVTAVLLIVSAGLAGVFPVLLYFHQVEGFIALFAFVFNIVAVCLLYRYQWEHGETW